MTGNRVWNGCTDVQFHLDNTPLQFPLLDLSYYFNVGNIEEQFHSQIFITFFATTIVRYNVGQGSERSLEW